MPDKLGTIALHSKRPRVKRHLLDTTAQYIKAIKGTCGPLGEHERTGYNYATVPSHRMYFTLA